MLIGVLNIRQWRRRTAQILQHEVQPGTRHEGVIPHV
jgi:hypothetical protein